MLELILLLAGVVLIFAINYYSNRKVAGPAGTEGGQLKLPNIDLSWLLKIAGLAFVLLAIFYIGAPKFLRDWWVDDSPIKVTGTDDAMGVTMIALAVIGGFAFVGGVIWAWRASANDEKAKRLFLVILAFAVVTLFVKVVSVVLTGPDALDFSTFKAPDLSKATEIGLKTWLKNHYDLLFGLLMIGAVIVGLKQHWQNPGRGAQHYVTLLIIVATLTFGFKLFLGEHADTVRTNLSNIAVSATVPSGDPGETGAGTVPSRVYKSGHLKLLTPGDNESFWVREGETVSFEKELGISCPYSPQWLDFDIKPTNNSRTHWEITPKESDAFISLHMLALGESRGAMTCKK